MAELNWADWTLICIITVSTLLSLKRGFVKEALSLASWVLAFIIARRFSPNLEVVLADVIEFSTLRSIVALLTLFIATLVVGSVVAKLVSTLITATGMAFFDRFLGMVFGLARGLIVTIVIVAILRLVGFAEQPWWKQSEVIQQLAVIEQWSRSVLESDVSKIIQSKS